MMKQICIASMLFLAASANGWAEETAAEPEVKLEQYISTYDYKKLLEDPRVTPYLDLLSIKQQKTFKQNFAVWSPIGYEGGFLVLSACRQHACHEHSALLLVHTHTGELTGYIYGDKKYEVFSTVDYQKQAEEAKQDWRASLPMAMQKQMFWNSRDTTKPAVEHIDWLEKQ